VAFGWQLGTLRLRRHRRSLPRKTPSPTVTRPLERARGVTVTLDFVTVDQRLRFRNASSRHRTGLLSRNTKQLRDPSPKKTPTCWDCLGSGPSPAVKCLDSDVGWNGLFAGPVDGADTVGLGEAGLTQVKGRTKKPLLF
jgi:hypothetical protein